MILWSLTLLTFNDYSDGFVILDTIIDLLHSITNHKVTMKNSVKNINTGT